MKLHREGSAPVACAAGLFVPLSAPDKALLLIILFQFMFTVSVLYTLLLLPGLFDGSWLLGQLLILRSFYSSRVSSWFLALVSAPKYVD